MPDLQNIPDKLYYSIGEVAIIFGVNTSLIRYWENEFDIVKPIKNKKGNRLFTRIDLENLNLIYHLVKERGFTLQGAKEKLKENKSDILDGVAIRESLEKLKEFLTELKKDL